MAEQFMGAVATTILDKGKQSININDLFSIEKQVSRCIRASKKAVLDISINDFYSVLDNYSTAFQLINDSLNFTKKQDIYNVLFLDGMDSKLRKELKSCVVNCYNQ